jgi:putative redox protein
MIRATSKSTNYQTAFSNGAAEALTDVLAAKGGTGEGFRPSELLEAAIATCMTITLKMYADAHGLPLEDVQTEVTLHSDNKAETLFRYKVELTGNALTEEQRAKLLAIADACMVKQKLSKPIRFEAATANQQANDPAQTVSY